MLLPFVDISDAVENIDLGLYYDHKTNNYYRGYDKNKEVPLTREGNLVIKDSIYITIKAKGDKANG